MRIPLVFLAGLLAFSHGFAADNLIRLSQPLKLELPSKDAAAKPTGAEADKAAGSATSKDVAKTDTPASASASASASAAVKSDPPVSADDPSMSAEEKAQQKLAETIKVRLAALRAKHAAKEALAQSSPKAKRIATAKAKRKDDEKTAEAHQDSDQQDSKQDSKQGHKHWAYDGEDGPSNWGKLSSAWTQCGSGKRQSPIDIHDGIKVDLEPIKFEYKPVHFKVIDDGHTIRVDLEPGNRISLTGRTYELTQFHFHRPSEERINGKGFQMVVHLVHKGDDGKPAVVALLVDEGTANGIIQYVWNNLPLEKNDPVVPTGTIDVTQLLPLARDYYTYMGSLTTPPCSEGVLWMVMKQPIRMSASQIGIFARLYPMNARPIQKSDERIIKESN